MKKNRGFTLIELVVVIVILGILAVIAAPKFLNLQDDAHESRADGAFSAFLSAAQMYHSAWLVEGEPQSPIPVSTYANGKIVASSAGYPRTTVGSSIPDCSAVWSNLLDTDLTIENHSDPILPSSSDIVTWYGNSTKGQYCYYYYISNVKSYSDDAPTLTYYLDSGDYKITIENLPKVP